MMESDGNYMGGWGLTSVLIGEGEDRRLHMALTYNLFHRLITALLLPSTGD